MSLTVATVLVGLLLLFKGGLLLYKGIGLRAQSLLALRSKQVALALLVVGAGWFLYRVTQLGESDFGAYKHYLFLAFLLVAIGSYLYVPDFLAVRAGAIVTLLASNEVLKAAFGHWDVPQRLFLVVVTYLAIIAALYLGTLPFRARDFCEWLFQNGRARLFGGAMAAYGALLLVVSTTY